jgi:hypothetical protein
VSGFSILAAAPLVICCWSISPCCGLLAVGAFVAAAPFEDWLCGAALVCCWCGEALFTTVEVQPLPIRCDVFSLVNAALLASVQTCSFEPRPPLSYSFCVRVLSTEFLCEGLGTFC